MYLEELTSYLKEKELDPMIELTRLAMDFYPDLATELLKKSKDLPDYLFKRIVEGIRNEEWSNEFYQNL